LINKKFNLQIPDEKLFGYALRLGSDCAFFLLNRPCLASGRGENLEPSDLTLSGFKIIVVNPAIHINTAEAFKNITPSIPLKRIKEIIAQPIDTWRKELINDFETSIFEKYPLIKKTKNELYESGAIYAAMSGTGSTVYGIFKDYFIADYSPHPDYFYKIIEVA
jgi:4-diphosphocytidyl-2-C-methyl-D-erythritol kinase